MDSLIERYICSNTRCFACGALVYAVEKKVTTNHIYHNRCFRCRICKRNLTGSTLNEEGDDIYCTNCYRKKQRGDCSGLDFQRAAAERAEYVHIDRHPDQSPPISNPRPPVRHDFSRHPSWTLHQLERQVLSHPEPNTDFYRKLEENYEKLMTSPNPLALKTSFSAPLYLTKVRNNSTLITNEPSPLLHFSPVFSPFPSPHPGSKPSTPKMLHKINEIQPKDELIKPTIISIDGIQSQLKQTNLKSPSTERKPSIIIDVNQTYINMDKKQSRFNFPPEMHLHPSRRRSSSANQNINRRKIK